MKKHITIVAAAIGALCIGLHPASAGLLGMPLNLKPGMFNLKVAVELRDVNAPAPGCQFFADDVFASSVLVRDC